MYLKYVLVASVILQLIASLIAFGLIKSTKFNSAWIFLSIGLFFVALLRLMNYTKPYLSDSPEVFFEKATIYFELLTSVLFILGLYFVKKILNHLFRLEKIRSDVEKRMLQVVVQAEENERKRISKELHDGLGPLLSSIKMSVSALSLREVRKEEKEIFQNSLHLVNESINGLREISNKLSPHVLEKFGLKTAISSFCSDISDAGTTTFHFRSNIADKRYDGTTEIALYRIVCELINNALKHAKAKSVLISLDEENGFLNLLYQDDGQGFDVEEVLIQGKGMGLQNLFSRSELLNGNVDVQSDKNQGVIITVTAKIN
ncbi:MAG: sensor histidine kinase [Lentimicrobiaceae bacterium]|jgi:signal transduction histidine kinase|nr:sensor histidine kinase [Lentimicrobiaceae bacterium]